MHSLGLRAVEPVRHRFLACHACEGLQATRHVGFGLGLDPEAEFDGGSGTSRGGRPCGPYGGTETQRDGTRASEVRAGNLEPEYRRESVIAGVDLGHEGLERMRSAGVVAGEATTQAPNAGCERHFGDPTRGGQLDIRQGDGDDRFAAVDVDGLETPTRRTAGHLEFEGNRAGVMAVGASRAVVTGGERDCAQKTGSYEPIAVLHGGLVLRSMPR